MAILQLDNPIMWIYELNIERKIKHDQLIVQNTTHKVTVTRSRDVRL